MKKRGRPLEGSRQEAKTFGRNKFLYSLSFISPGPVDHSTGLLCDQEVELIVFYSQQDYPARLRRIRYRDAEGRRLVFLTNQLKYSPTVIK